MDTKNEMTLVFDNELSEAWGKIRNRKHISFSEYIKEVITKENLKYSTYNITQSVKAVSGTLKTQLEYKLLKDKMTEKRLSDYENIR